MGPKQWVKTFDSANHHFEKRTFHLNETGQTSVCCLPCQTSVCCLPPPQKCHTLVFNPLLNISIHSKFMNENKINVMLYFVSGCFIKVLLEMKNRTAKSTIQKKEPRTSGSEEWREQNLSKLWSLSPVASLAASYILKMRSASTLSFMGSLICNLPGCHSSTSVSVQALLLIQCYTVCDSDMSWTLRGMPMPQVLFKGVNI